MEIIKPMNVIGRCIYEEYEESIEGGKKDMKTYK